jgi:lactate racemase
MITLSIPYGDKALPLKIPEEHWGELLVPREVLPVSLPNGLKEAINNPLDCPPLDDFLKGSRSLLIVVNDETRPTPTGQILELLWSELASFPIKIMVAAGTHQPSSEEGCRRIFGPLWSIVKDYVFFHDSREERGMVFLGETSRGTRVVINQQIMMADRLLVIGSVEPHYFAGYTGGRKAIVPGMAAFSSIVANHSLAMDMNARPLRLAGNPVHEDLEEALCLLPVPPIFSLMLVLTPKHQLYAAYSGSIHETLTAGALKADEVFSIPFQQKADIVISVVYPPLDIDLYQSQKPIEHGKMALKEDGILILVMPCPQGPGSPDFQQLMLQSGDPEKARLLLYQPYSLGHHRLIRNLKFLEEGGQVWGITGLDPNFLSQTFIRPLPSLQEAVDKALVQKGRDAKVHVLLNAGLCVPRQG